MDSSAKNAELNLALQVALQTMKERCAALQKRLVAMEAENQEMHERYADKSGRTAPVGSNFSGGAAELFQLRLQLADMQRQKNQLSNHVNMVSEENRQLWSRLSQLAKDAAHLSGLDKDVDNILMNDAFSVSDAQTGTMLAHQHLIRSKTFTQHAPNPQLRHKLVLDDSGEQLLGEPSLEEVALNKNCEEDANSDCGNDSDFDVEVKKCYDGFQQLQREAQQQHFELNTALNTLGSKFASITCAECAQRAQKPEMADKSLETDDSITEMMQYNNSNKNDTEEVQSNLMTGSNVRPAPRLNIIQEKIEADAMDKICPMCGRNYSSLVSFDDFREHVEQHFIDDSNDLEASIDRNFEFVSHAVGDF